MAGAAAAQEINLYTTLEPGLIQPLIDAYSKDSSVKINTIFLKDGLAERVKSEGDNSPADILMTVDAGALVDLVDQGLTQSVESSALNGAIPETLRDANGHWYALSVRARAVYGVANSYYLGIMRNGKGGPEQQEWSNAVKMILPKFENGGTQVNITGAAIAKNAPNKDAAVKFMEYLVSDDAQAIYAQANYEYPVNDKAVVDPIIAEYGVLAPDTIGIVDGVKFRKEATELTERVGFDS